MRALRFAPAALVVSCLLGGAFASVPALAAGPPAIEVESSSGVTQTSAILNASIDPDGEGAGVRTTYEFDLGTDTSYGTRIFGEEALSGSGSQAVTVGLQGLAPGVSYHFRVGASNAFGTAYGVDQTFATSTFPSSLLSAPSTPALVPAPPFLAPATASTASARPPARSASSANARHERKQRARSGGTGRARGGGRAKR
jgi:hypothetical protein